MLIVYIRKKNQDKKLKLSPFRVGFMFFGLRRSRQTDRHVGHPVCFVSIDNNYVTIVCFIVHSPRTRTRVTHPQLQNPPASLASLPWITVTTTPRNWPKKFSMSGVASKVGGGWAGWSLFPEEMIDSFKINHQLNKIQKRDEGKNWKCLKLVLNKRSKLKQNEVVPKIIAPQR